MEIYKLKLENIMKYKYTNLFHIDVLQDQGKRDHAGVGGLDAQPTAAVTAINGGAVKLKPGMAQKYNWALFTSFCIF